MRAFPPSSELQFLVGEVIGQIALDPHSIQFRFESGRQISVACPIEHIDEAGRTHAHGSQASSNGAIYLHQLIQRQVVVVESAQFNLEVGFDGGAVLRIFSEESPYECGQICEADMRCVIVF